MSHLYTKQPSEEETIGVKFSDRLPAGESIDTVTVTAIDLEDNSDATTTVIDNYQEGTVAADDKTFTAGSGPDVGIDVKGGTDGKRYKITVKVVTDYPHTLEEDIIMTVTGE